MSEPMEWQDARCSLCGYFKKTHQQMVTQKEIEDGFIPEVSGACRRINWHGTDLVHGNDRACPAFVYGGCSYQCSECTHKEHFHDGASLAFKKLSGWERIGGKLLCCMCAEDLHTGEADQ